MKLRWFGIGVLGFSLLVSPAWSQIGDAPGKKEPETKPTIRIGIPDLAGGFDSPAAEEIAAEAASCPDRLALKAQSAQIRTAAATQKIEKVVAETLGAIRAIDEEMEKAAACGQSLNCFILRAQRVLNEARAATQSAFIAYKSETADRAIAGLKSTILRVRSADTVEGARASFAEGMIDFAKSLGIAVKDSVLAVRSKHLLSDPTVLADFMKRWVNVMAFQGIAMGLAAWQNWDNPNFSSPTEIFFNTTVLMWLQSEVGAKNTVTETPTPKDRFDFYRLMPKIVAGEHGFVAETYKRFVGFAALWPVEVFVLAMVKMAGIGLSEGVPALTSLQVWKDEAWASASFVSLFGVYLAVKWSFIDKLVELRGLPMVQKMISREYREKYNALAAANGIPHKGAAAWNGLMVRQFIESFLPTADAQTGKVRFHQYFTHILGLKFVGKLREHFVNRTKFKDFMAKPEMVTLQNSPEAKRAWWGQFWEFVVYRVPVTLFDAYVAIRIMGAEDAAVEQDLSQEPAPAVE